PQGSSHTCLGVVSGLREIGRLRLPYQTTTPRACIRHGRPRRIFPARLLVYRFTTVQAVPLIHPEPIAPPGTTRVPDESIAPDATSGYRLIASPVKSRLSAGSNPAA